MSMINLDISEAFSKMRQTSQISSYVSSGACLHSYLDPTLLVQQTHSVLVVWGLISLNNLQDKFK